MNGLTTMELYIVISCQLYLILMNYGRKWKENGGSLRYMILSNQKRLAKHIPITLCMSNLMLCNFIEIRLQHVGSIVNFLNVFRTHFPKNTSGWLLQTYDFSSNSSANKKTFLKLFTPPSLNLFRVFVTFCQWFFTAFAILLLYYTAFTILFPFKLLLSKKKKETCYLLLEFDIDLL